MGKKLVLNRLERKGVLQEVCSGEDAREQGVYPLKGKDFVILGDRAVEEMGVKVNIWGCKGPEKGCLHQRATVFLETGNERAVAAVGEGG